MTYKLIISDIYLCLYFAATSGVNGYTWVQSYLITIIKKSLHGDFVIGYLNIRDTLNIILSQTARLRGRDYLYTVGYLPEC